MKKLKLRKLIRKEINKQKINEISRKAISRMDGMANIKAMKTLKQSIKIIKNDLTKEGFEEDEISEYITYIFYEVK